MLRKCKHSLKEALVIKEVCAKFAHTNKSVTTKDFPALYMVLSISNNFFNLGVGIFRFLVNKEV